MLDSGRVFVLYQMFATRTKIFLNIFFTVCLLSRLQKKTLCAFCVVVGMETDYTLLWLSWKPITLFLLQSFISQTLEKLLWISALCVFETMQKCFCLR